MWELMSSEEVEEPPLQGGDTFPTPELCFFSLDLMLLP